MRPYRSLQNTCPKNESDGEDNALTCALQKMQEFSDMKSLTVSLPRFNLRLRPGGYLFLRPPLLRQLNWMPEDVWFLELNHGRLSLLRRPSEREWRIHRLRIRISPGYAALWCGSAPYPRTRLEFLRGNQCRPVERIPDTIIRHITPAGGNVFADLGFPPEEAAALKLESDRQIDQTLLKREAR